MPRRATVAVGVIYIVWGANFLAVDIAVNDISPAAMMGIRFLVAGLLLLPIAHRFGPRSTKPADDWRSAAVVAVPLFAGGSGLLAWGQTYLPSGIAAVVISTIPIWLLGIAIARGEISLNTATVTPPLVGLVGVVVIANPNTTDPVSPTGCALVLAAAIAWAIGSRRSRSTSTHNVIEQTAMQMTIGGGILCGIAGVLAALGQSPGRLTLLGAVATVWLIVISSMIGFTAYTYALKHAPLTVVAAYPYANIAIAVALGALLLREAVTPARIVGTVVVVSATLLSRRVAREPLRTPEASQPQGRS